MGRVSRCSSQHVDAGSFRIDELLSCSIPAWLLHLHITSDHNMVQRTVEGIELRSGILTGSRSSICALLVGCRGKEDHSPLRLNIPRRGIDMNSASKDSLTLQVVIIH